jgi:hypothetical protein
MESKNPGDQSVTCALLSAGFREEHALFANTDGLSDEEKGVRHPSSSLPARRYCR